MLPCCAVLPALPWIDTVAASLPQSGERPCFGKGCIQETYKMHTSLRNTLRVDDLGYACRLHMALPASLSKEARAQWHKLVEGFREPIPMIAVSQVCCTCLPSSVSSLPSQ